MGAKKWTLISQTVTDHIVVPKTATNTNITRLLLNAKSDWTSIAKIVNKYEIKNGTHNSVIQRIRDIKNGKITELSQITKTSSDESSSSGSSDENSSSGSSDESSSSSSVEDSGPLNSTISRVPITDPKEALGFAKTEWNKIRRTSGHELECQVFGSNEWKVGEWCKVYLPTLNEYTDMYITKVDHSNDSNSEWLVSLTLTDYPPSLSSVDEEDISDGGSSTSESSEDGSSADTESQTSKWTDVARILQTYYEKPSDGWNNSIRAVVNAKVYDPDIKNVITKMKKKAGQDKKTYIDVGHDLCDVLEITY